METFNITYSKKNIPLPSEHEYKIMLTSKIELFIKRLRWRALKALGKIEFEKKETYGFPSQKCPPVVEETANFESDLMNIIKNIKFRHTKNQFQQKISEDVRNIKHVESLLVPADKSRNIYIVEPVNYKKLLTENITKEYKKSNSDKRDKINNEAKNIVKKLGIEERVQRMSEEESYVTIKDHKENFPNKISCRLINPSKSEIGKISKHILDDINNKIKTIESVNQWKNTTDVLKWFTSFPRRRNQTFINFDVETFYPSISLELLTKALEFAKTKVNISDQQWNIILHARKTLLFTEGESWVKKSGQEDFDVPMGCFDGAEICELVGSFILTQLAKILPKHSIGLYRDDGLGIINGLSGPALDRKRKDIIKVFKDNGLNITIQMNLKIVDFLDVTLSLIDYSFKPYRKPNNPPVYIHKESNHPPIIKKQLPKMIATRISELSSNEEIFNENIDTYKKALEKSGFNPDEVVFIKQDERGNNRKIEDQRRKRNITWFNPPYSDNVETNIGQIFFRSLDRNFPRGHILHKVFNRNTVKLSYSCMKNISTIISSHNKNILKAKHNNNPSCNCRVKTDCPLDNKCSLKNTIYEATVTNNENDEVKYYMGAAETTFKVRYSNHKKDFNHEQYEKSTALSKYVWELKRQNITAKVTFKTLKIGKGGPRRNFCPLCLNEKILIIEKIDNPNYLNSRSELISKCRHINKHLLMDFKSKKKKNN